MELTFHNSALVGSYELMSHFVAPLAKVLERKQKLVPHEHNAYSALTYSKQTMHTTCLNILKRLDEPTYAEADCIAVTGTSGLSVAMLLVYVYDVSLPILYVRKPTERSHGLDIELIAGRGYFGDRRFAQAIFVDDCTSSGKTRRRVAESLMSKGTKLHDEDIYYDRS